MIQLAKSKVIFEEEPHKYFLDGREIHGVTSTILQWLFPSTYEGIDDEVLARAADRGHAIHREIEVVDSCGFNHSDVPEVNDYISLREQNNLTTIANEYLITDGKQIASAIDVVYERDGEVFLCDIKCTASLHIPNVTAQLSIYRYLFCLQNPDIMPSDIAYVCWLPRASYGYKSRMATVSLISVDETKLMVEAYLRGEDAEKYRQWFSTEETQLPSKYADMLTAIANIETKVKDMKAQQETMKEQLLTYFREHGIKSFKSDLLSITYVEPTERVSIDSKKLQANHPDIYDECKKTSKVKDSIRIKIKE